MVKRKNEAEAGDKLALSTEEVNFPRGGASILTPLEHREIANKAAKDLFSAKTSTLDPLSEPATKKRKSADAKKTKVHAKTTDGSSEKRRTPIDAFSFKKLTVGSMVLGCITQINELNFLVSLPNQLTGVVPVTEVSDALTRLLEAAADEDDDDEDTTLPDISSIFYIGQWVQCSVTSVEETDGKKRIELSIKPSVVNAGIVKSDITQGLVIGASVDSVEDHGYILSLGVNGMAGFCRHGDAKSYIEKYNRGEQLVVGQYVECLVKDVSKNKRTVNLTMDRKAIGSARLESPFSKMGSIIAGQRVDGLVEYADVYGLKVKFMGLYDAIINVAQLPFTNKVTETYSVGSTVSFRIMFADMVTEQKLVMGSLLPHVIQLNHPTVPGHEDASNYICSQFSFGTHLDEVTVVRVSPIGVTVTIKDLENVMGFIHISQLSDERIAALSHKTGKFTVGSTHRARILSYSPVDAVLSLTTKASILDDAYLQYSDVIVGDIIEGTVVKLVEKGLIVKLSSRINGFVQSHHLADVKLSRPELKFKIGSKVRARVLLVDEQRGRVMLTLKKSLVNTELPLIKSLDDAQPKLATHGVIVKVLPNGCIIGFYNNLTAFCPGGEMTEAKGVNLMEAFHAGQTVKVFILDVVRDTEKMIISLVRDSQLTDAERENKKNKTSKVKDEQAVYEVGTVIDGAKVTDTKHMQLTLKMPNGTTGWVHITEIYNKFDDIPVDQRQNVLQSFKDQLLKVKVISVRNAKAHNNLAVSHKHKTHDVYQCSLKLDQKEQHKKDLKCLKYNEELVGFVTEIKHDHLRVAIDSHSTGTVRKQHTSSDVVIANHFGKHFTPGQAVMVSVLNVVPAKRKLELVLIKRGDQEEQVIAIPDIKSLKTGQVLNGLVQKADEKGELFVQLSNGLTGKVHPTDISDTFVENPSKSIKENRVVKCKVLEVDTNRKRINLSLRSSCVNNTPITSPKQQREIKSFDDIHVGDVLKAYVQNISSAGVFIAYSRHIHARVKIAQLSDDFVKEWKSLYTVGQLVESKVVFVDADLKRVEASLKRSTVLGIEPSKKKSEEELPDVDEDEESEDEPMEGQVESSDEENEEEDGDGDVAMAEASDDGDDDDDDSDAEEEADSDEDDDSEDDDNDGRNSDDEDKEHVSALPIDKFDWSGQTAILRNEAENESGDSESDSDDDDKKKKDNKKKKQVEDKTAELNSAAPQSVGDFERLVVGSPNSSYLWINYMAYQLQLSEIAKARAIGERALKTISFREEQEKMNVWVALMNLENQFGTDATLEEVFKRALKFNEPEKVYLQLVKIYERSEKWNKAEELWKETVKKFSQSSKVWTMFGLYYLQQGNVEGARELLQRSLKSLPKHKHIETIVKFAQMEFKHGEAERGRTIMEGVMNSSPKRVDLWNVYLDMEIKAGDHDMVQRLFERVTSMKFSSKKMKFLFKKWLQFEKDHGSSDDVERVKERTLAYVESISA